MIITVIDRPDLVKVKNMIKSRIFGARQQTKTLQALKRHLTGEGQIVGSGGLDEVLRRNKYTTFGIGKNPEFLNSFAWVRARRHYGG